MNTVNKKADNTIICIVTVNRDRKPQPMLDATDRPQYTDKDVVATMPTNGTGIQEGVEVIFFKLGKYVSDDDLAKEYEARGLTSDPYAQAAVNEADRAFADEHLNGTHWKNGQGKWCRAYFSQGGDERYVRVYRGDFDWRDYWWFAGVRK